jgi:hypothetical protein
MRSSKPSDGALRRRRGRGSLAIVGLLTITVGGCATPPGHSPLAALRASSDEAALKKAIENDSFPSASQVGLASPARK